MKSEFKPKKQEKKEAGREITNLKNKEWGKQLPYIRELQKEGAEKFFKGRGNLREMFRPRTEIAVCMDEGTAMKKREKGNFTWADTGRLLDKDGEKALEKAADVAIELGLTEITSHDGCGAAKIGWKWDNPKEKREPTDKEVDDYAKDWTEKLAEKIKSKSKEMDKGIKEVRVNHIPAEEMLRPKEIHNASVVYYYGGVGGFNPGDLENIPQGFVISRGGLEKALGSEKAKDNCCQALGIACSIALGSHGFGKFCKGTPFTIIAIGKNLEHVDALKKEARGFIEGSDSKKDLEKGRIKIDGFLAPEGL